MIAARALRSALSASTASTAASMLSRRRGLAGDVDAVTVSPRATRASSRARVVGVAARRRAVERRPRDVRRWNDEEGFGYETSADDEEDDATKDWMAGVAWLPKMNPTKATETDPALAEGEMVLPMFPLGSHVYLPETEHVLNIFEPRYRAMYSDILFNGSRRFVVPMCAPQEPGVFASVASVFYLDDLKEVSEQTNDAVKFVCSHTVIERVRVKRVLNDAVWGDRSSYLKVVTEKFEDCDEDEDFSNKETALVERFKQIIDMQTKVDEPVRFTGDLSETLSAKRGKDGFWRMVSLWQSLLQSRVQSKEGELSQNVQTLLRGYLEKTGVDLQDGRQIQLEFASLPDNIKAELARMQEEYKDECVVLLNEAIYPFQYLVQKDSHAERLDYFGELMEQEEKRLAAKNMLRNMFSSSDSPGGETDSSTD